MKKSRFILLLGIITTTCLLPVGKADWSTLKKSGTLVASSSTAVCYIGSTKFTTLDDALYYAEANNTNDKIYVIPGLNAELKIEKSHTINEGDALLLPYDTPTDEDDKINSETGSSNTGFADNNATSNRRTLVTLGSGVELTIKGTLSIGAITGTTAVSAKKTKTDNTERAIGQAGWAGQASSSYCELKMGNNSKLIVDGTLNCYGFIKDSDSKNSSIIINGAIEGNQEGGKLTTPVVFYDFEGGTMLENIYTNGVFPLSQFDIPQIRPKMTFNYGSTLIGEGRVYSSTKKFYMTLSANLLGISDSFINMGEGSTIDWQYTDSDSSTSNYFTSHSTSIIISKGSLEFGSLTVSFIDSSAFYLPIPCGYSIIVEGGATFTLPSKAGSKSIKGVKFMPGSSLECQSGGTINFNSNALFYQGTTSSNDENVTFAYPTSNPAVCSNNGTMNINAGFEGKITTSSGKTNTAILAFGTSYKPLVDSKEGTNDEAIYNNSNGSSSGASGKIAETETSQFFEGYFVKNEEDQDSLEYPSKAGTVFWIGKSGSLLPDIDDVIMQKKNSSGEYEKLSWWDDPTKNSKTFGKLESGSNAAADYLLKAAVKPANHSDPHELTYYWVLNKTSQSITNRTTEVSVTVTISLSGLTSTSGSWDESTMTFTSKEPDLKIHTSANSSGTTTKASFTIKMHIEYKARQDDELKHLPYKKSSKGTISDRTVDVTVYASP